MSEQLETFDQFLGDLSEASLKKRAPGLYSQLSKTQFSFSDYSNSERDAARPQLKDAMHQLINEAESQKRDFTRDESREYKELERVMDAMEGGKLAPGQQPLHRPTPTGSTYNSAGPNTMASSSGSSARIFASNEKIATAGAKSSLTIGAAMRDMALGARTESMRAALSEGVDTAGGYTVPTKLLEQLVDLMRNKMRVNQAGAQTVMLDTEKTSMARLAADPACAWRLESAAVAESDPTFDNVSFQARSLAVLVKVSRELLEDSINVESALLNALAQSLALKLDLAALYGSGVAPEPLGVYNDANIHTIDMGTDGAVLGTHAPILAAAELLSAANSAAPTAAIMAPRTLFEIAGFADTTGQPLNRPRVLDDLAYLESNQVPIDETQGTSDVASNIIVGDFTQLMVGIRSAMRIELLTQPFAENLQVGFLAHLRADVAIAQPTAFCRIIGINPTA